MKWQHDGRYEITAQGTSRARLYYFVTDTETSNGEWMAGYYGFGKRILMKSAGTFQTAQDAKDYCEKQDREAVIFEAI